MCGHLRTAHPKNGVDVGKCERRALPGEGKDAPFAGRDQTPAVTSASAASAVLAMVLTSQASVVQ